MVLGLKLGTNNFKNGLFVLKKKSPLRIAIKCNYTFIKFTSIYGTQSDNSMSFIKIIIFIYKTIVQSLTNIAK